MGNDDLQFEDSENYNSNGESDSFGNIVLRHLRKCIEEGSKEMDEGGLKKRIIKGQVVEIMVPDQREVFFNAVDMLYILLIPDFEVKEKIKEQMEKLDNTLNKIREVLLFEKKENINEAKKKERANPKDFDLKKTLNNISQEHINKFEECKFEYSKEKLKIISRLLKELNYFAEGSVWYE